MPTSKTATFYRGSSRVSKLSLGSVQLWPLLTKTRYFNTTSVLANIRAANTIGEIIVALGPVGNAYGISILGNSAGNSDTYVGGADYWDGVAIADTEAVRTSAIVITQEFAKYPPIFWDGSTTLKVIHLAKNLIRTNTAGAQTPMLGLTRQEWVVFNVYQSEPDIRRVIHHELTHAWNFTALTMPKPGTNTTTNSLEIWANEIRPQWVNSNASGSYITPYAMTDPTEDLAETMAYMMCDHLQSYILDRARTETGIAAKVALTRQYIGRLSIIMGDENYWRDVVVGR